MATWCQFWQEPPPESLSFSGKALLGTRFERTCIRKQVRRIQTQSSLWMSGCGCLSRKTTSLDKLIVEFSGFFILKALKGDTAAPRLATETEPPSKRPCFAPSAKLSPSFYADDVWHRLLALPRTYQAFCQSLMGDHDPRSKDQNQRDR